MGLKAFLSKPLAAWVVRKQNVWAKSPINTQQKVFKKLLHSAQNTLFGVAHHFKDIQTYEDFKACVPIRSYEALLPYIEKIKTGEKDVLWQGRPLYFAKTSGTTAGNKYIPITKESISHHILSARNALLSYIDATSNTSFLAGKMIFLSGSPQLGQVGGIPTGRLSGIVNHHIPAYLRSHQLPGYPTNCIEDWEKKLDKIIDETMAEKMTLISGIPPWIQMYFDKLQERIHKSIKNIFPHFSLFVHGGVNFEPYRKKLFESIDKEIDTIETYPASEGFLAFQDSRQTEGLLLQLDSGIFFEFIPAEEYLAPHPERLSIEAVELGVNYAIILNSNAGLWGYSLGDTVKFISKDPYRIIVTGRVKHFISAFGEHVIAEEVEKAMQYALQKYKEVKLIEFTVAPYVSKCKEEASYHEWLIEFAELPENIHAFARSLEQHLQGFNTYYDDLIQNKILAHLKITLLEKDAFRRYMKAQGKLGGQNKVPRLANDRCIADALLKYKLK